MTKVIISNCYFWTIMEMTGIQVNLKRQIIDESFEHGMVENGVLFATIDDHQFCYFILDKARNKAVVIKDYHILMGSGKSAEFFQTVFASDDILRNYNPAKKVLAIQTNACALTPDPLFSRENMRDGLSLVSRLKHSDIVYSDFLPIANTHLTYSIPFEFNSAISTYFSGASLVNALSSFIEIHLMNNKHRQYPAVMVNVRKHTMDVVVCKGNELLFCNSFEHQTGEDFIYYLLYVMEQLQLNPDVHQVIVFGEIERNSSAWLIAQKYIRYLMLGDKPENFEYAYGFDQLLPSQYHFLFSQILCV
jgi:hypothetical protein